MASEPVLPAVPNSTPTTDRDFDGLHKLGYLTDREYAAIIKKSVRQLWEDRRRGIGPPHTKVGKQIFYRIDAVRQYLARHERTQSPPRFPQRKAKPKRTKPTLAELFPRKTRRTR